jgi:hypothetical protein
MRKLLQNRLALSTVVTSLIILVISVLLAGTVTYFAINVTSTRVQEESLALAKPHAWCDSSVLYAEAAIMVINTGGRDLVIDKFTVRGQESAWGNIYYAATSQSISSDLTYLTSSDLTTGSSVPVGTGLVFKNAVSDLTLPSGKTMIIYIKNPDSISVNDVGLTVSITVFTSQAMYHKETNVQGSQYAPTSTVAPQTSHLTQSQINIWYDGDGNQMSMVITNNGESSETITGISLNSTEFNTANNYGMATWLYSDIGTFTISTTLPYNTELIGNPFSVSGHTLSVTNEGSTLTPFSIPAGQTAIIYLNRLWWITTYGNTESVTLQVQGAGTVNLGSAVVAHYAV